MSPKTTLPRWIRVALLACALAFFGTGTALLAQQAAAPAVAAPVAAPAQVAVSTPAAATPAPHESVLFAQNDPNAPTLAAAKSAHDAARASGDNHTIVVSTLVLVLAVVILVLLIA